MRFNASTSSKTWTFSTNPVTTSSPVYDTTLVIDMPLEIKRGINVMGNTTVEAVEADSVNVLGDVSSRSLAVNHPSYGSEEQYFKAFVDENGGSVRRGSIAYSSHASEDEILNMGDNDGRYCKFMELTSTQYQSLSEKEETTVYITTDTNKVYLGSIVLN